MSDNLKPCPVCGREMKIGGQTMILPDTCVNWYRSICVACGWETRLCDTYHEAVETSNARPIEDAQAAEITELRAELAAMECLESEGYIGAEQQQSLYDELEAKNKEQVAEIERLRAVRDEEIQQFNDGYDAFELGETIDSYPLYESDTDQWRIGWVWAQYKHQRGERC